MPGGQVVHNVQELELGRVDEHDAPVLLRPEHIGVSRHERDKVLTNELQVVVPRVETQHWHLREPFKKQLVLRLWNPFHVWWQELGTHIRHDCFLATLKGLVEAVDKVSRVAGDNVLRLRVECVRDGN